MTAPHRESQPVCRDDAKRDMLAAMLLARDEAEYHKPIPVGLIEWGATCIRAGRDAKHSGDCTNECHTCGRCLADSTLAQADQILAALGHGECGVQTRDAVIEECAKVAEAQAQAFLSPQYAANQPFGSLCERFACEEVAKAIRALALSSAERGSK